MWAKYETTQHKPKRSTLSVEWGEGGEEEGGVGMGRGRGGSGGDGEGKLHAGVRTINPAVSVFTLCVVMPCAELSLLGS